MWHQFSVPLAERGRWSPGHNARDLGALVCVNSEIVWPWEHIASAILGWGQQSSMQCIECAFVKTCWRTLFQVTIWYSTTACFRQAICFFLCRWQSGLTMPASPTLFEACTLCTVDKLWYHVLQWLDADEMIKVWCRLHLIWRVNRCLLQWFDKDHPCSSAHPGASFSNFSTVFCLL